MIITRFIKTIGQRFLGRRSPVQVDKCPCDLAPRVVTTVDHNGQLHVQTLGQARIVSYVDTLFKIKPEERLVVVRKPMPADEASMTSRE